MQHVYAMQAGLIIVYASSGRTASLVAKYRPKMPILTLVVPHLRSSALKWELQGRSLARQCLIMRGQLLPLPLPTCVPAHVTRSLSPNKMGPKTRLVFVISDRIFAFCILRHAWHPEFVPSPALVHQTGLHESHVCHKASQLLLLMT